MDYSSMTIKELSRGLSNGDFSSLDLTNYFLNKEDDVSAYISKLKKSALEQAKEADERIKSGERGELLGIPMAVKDNIMIKGVKCTSASLALKDYIPPYDATVIKKLKEAGVVFLGKTNLDEFAMGSSTESSYFGVTLNPCDKTRVPGGSSGGSAAAVASGLTVSALGSDTGGSIRQPAAFCGVVGLKPTYGSVSRYGLAAMASSLDQIGVISKNVEDTEIVFKSIFGRDVMDSTSADYSFNDIDVDKSKLKIGIPKEYFVDGMDQAMKEEIEQSIKDLDVDVVEISLPHTKYALSAYYIITSSEVSSNMGKYDGLRYGFSDNSAKDLIDSYFKNRGGGFGKEVKRRIILGTHTLSAGYKDAYYQKALEVRHLIRQDFLDAFKSVDLIITPVSPSFPFKIGEKITDPLEMYLLDIFTVTINLAGLPALSMPCSKVNNLPVGIQIIGKHFEEAKILSAAKQFEKIWK
ncbi:MAG: Glutamyl-tRNA(Gln) amidotransferase subunit A [Parcubacteria group bacterium ADurb.Bin247]|jgi:aspartyl-tRNA(Asn)/glutamyl-tRNA(Gln) amidotransferase subunit A|nr:MAG: Glutamyl-tRNA(Gln) amidotransferase subunit A [Parcubacteria group bacterium ADurb.Bin247]